MDVDSPVTLKRSSSAPMINELNTTMTTASTTSTTRDSSPFNNCPSSQPRTRRFSASFSPSQNASGSAPRLTPRVSQLRQEECIDVAGREAAHEREIHSAMQMSQSWEDLALATGSPTQRKPENCETSRRPGVGLFDQLHLTLPACPPVCTSPSPTPSPTRMQRQCFSPGIQIAWKNTTPSPTRTFPRRSQSPVPMRPSSLGPVKRKCELEEDKLDQYGSPPAKRPNCYGLDRGGLLMAHSNRLDATSSPLPGSLSSVGTPESLSSADSPGFTFRPLDSPSPGRSMITVADEPMHEEQPTDLSKQDLVMASVEQSPS